MPTAYILSFSLPLLCLSRRVFVFMTTLTVNSGCHIVGGWRAQYFKIISEFPAWKLFLLCFFSIRFRWDFNLIAVKISVSFEWMLSEMRWRFRRRPLFQQCNRTEFLSWLGNINEYSGVRLVRLVSQLSNINWSMLINYLEFFFVFKMKTKIPCESKRWKAERNETSEWEMYHYHHRHHQLNN